MLIHSSLPGPGVLDTVFVVQSLDWEDSISRLCEKSASISFLETWSTAVYF